MRRMATSSLDLRRGICSFHTSDTWELTWHLGLVFDHWSIQESAQRHSYYQQTLKRTRYRCLGFRGIGRGIWGGGTKETHQSKEGGKSKYRGYFRRRRRISSHRRCPKFDGENWRHGLFELGIGTDKDTIGVMEWLGRFILVASTGSVEQPLEFSCYSGRAKMSQYPDLGWNGTQEPRLSKAKCQKPYKVSHKALAVAELSSWEGL